MMRKILWALLGVVVFFLAYYLFLRPYEFEVKFRAKTLPGDLIETIRIWNRSLENAQIVEVDSFTSVKQNIVLGKRAYTLYWQFDATDDSVTHIAIQMAEKERGLWNKILIPFTNQPIEQDAEKIGTEFYDIVQEHLRITKVRIIGEAVMDSSICVCRSLKTDQIEKANGMMMDYPLLTSFITAHKLQAVGAPLIKVKYWDHNSGTLEYDFCFPIQPVDSLPQNKLVFYRRFGREKALKAEYRGNYITSDRAWYALINYAIKNGYRINGQPVEYFHDNPNLGMNEFHWKTDVYLPIESN